jgi:hypothetical protein
MIRIAVGFALIAALTGCGRDLRLPGGYLLERWEDGKTFYLWAPGDSKREGGGAIEGTVKRIAWNDELIVAERYSTFRGDPDGWMAIDVKSHKVSGPLSNAEFSDIQAKYHFAKRSASDIWASR